MRRLGLGFAGRLVVPSGLSGAAGASSADPAGQDALDRLDATLPGRPIATLTDTQAIGASDPASHAVWAAHQARMAARAATARAVAPDLRLATRDPFGLRYIALTALVMALMFGSIWRVASVAGLANGAGAPGQRPKLGRLGATARPIPASRRFT